MRYRNRNRCLDLVLTELDAVGARYRLERRKHVRVFWTVKGSSGTTTVPTSASDWRAPLNARSGIRRQLNGHFKKE